MMPRPTLISESLARRLRWHDRLYRLIKRQDWDLPRYDVDHEKQVRLLAERYAVLRDKCRSPKDRETLTYLIGATEKYARLCGDVIECNRTRPR